ncbi:MAG: metal ABC transporter permease [Myxococcota bacterium]|nr:metal ABC transporter permease [Myxococcota bacterium]
MNELPGIDLFMESWSLFADAVWAGVLAGMTLGILGVYIVLGRMVFLTAALSQVAGLGVASTFFLLSTAGGLFVWLTPGLGGLSCVLVCLMFALRFDEQDRAKRDAVLGILFVGGSSGTRLIGGLIPQEMADIQSLLFGSAVAILPEDLMVLAGVVAVVLVIQLAGWRGFVEMMYDPTSAQVRQLPVDWLRLVLVGSLAVMVALTTRTLGALPTFAFTILPAIFGIRLAANAPRAMLIAALTGAVMGAVGYFLAFRYGFPVGASQTLVGLTLVLAGNSLAWLLERGRARTSDVTAPDGQTHPRHAHHGHASSSSEQSQK